MLRREMPLCSGGEEGEGGGGGRGVTKNFKKTRQQHQRERRLKFTLLVLLRDYSNSFNLYSMAALSSNSKCGKSVQVETDNEKFTVMS